MDFFVRNDQCVYFDNLPHILQIADHQFIERRLIVMWRTSTNAAWVSFANCATLYLNTHKATKNQILESWKFKGKLDGKNVVHAFILLALLKNHKQRNTTLQIPHSGLQSEHYKTAMHEKNDCMRQYGQPELCHRCKTCVCKYTNNRQGTLSVFYSNKASLSQNNGLWLDST